MKRLMLINLLLLLAAMLSAYSIMINSFDIRADVKVLNRERISVDYVNESEGVIIAYVRDTAEELKLRSLGFETIAIPNPVPGTGTDFDPRDGSNPDNAYLSIDDYNSFMINTAAQYPNICQLVQVGSTIQNRPIYYLKITDNVSIAENEPEVRLVSSVHGDEVVGFDLLIRLIQLLTSQYNVDPRVTEIVNNTELWINPMANPDGYVLQQRFNAAGVDINRNFPMPTGNQHPDGNNWTPETEAFMNFANSRSFSQSMNFHGGALVINYPWDYTYALAPDNDLIIQMSLAYSTPNTAMYNGQFSQGITNGAAWYVITGSLQDWSYGYTDAIDLTGEISNVKWPAASTLDSYWNQNRESLLAFIEFAQRGLHGTVTSTTGEALDAQINISGNQRTINTDPTLGDYHRPLLGGTYQVTASAHGYIGQTQSVTIAASSSANLNFVLEEAQMVSFLGTVRDTAGYPIPQAQVSVSTSPQTIITSATDGSFLIPAIFEGIYELSITASGYGNLSNQVLIDASNDHQVFVMMQPIFMDDFESGLSNWTAVSPWGIGQDGSNSVLMDSPAGNYSNNINRAVTLTNPVSLAGIQNPQLSLKAKYIIEDGYDFVYVEASSNGSTWTELHAFTGSQVSWESYSFSLASFAGQNLQLRFRIVTDSSLRFDGISIDDVQISGLGAGDAVYGDVTSEGIIDRNDAYAALAYAIGLDSLPILDPRPWEDARIALADVDDDGILSTVDAYLIHRYVLDPGYRFPVQTGSPIEFTDPGLQLSFHDGVLQLEFENPEALKSLDIQVDHPASTLLQNLSPDAALWAFNPDLNRLALVNHDPMAPLQIELSTSSASIICAGWVNGMAFEETVVISTSNADAPSPAIVNQLGQNYPNPFNPSTTISFSIAKSNNHTCLKIFNARGQLVRTLLDAPLEASVHQISWDGRDDLGNEVTSGLYFYHLSTGSFRQTKKMLLLK